MFLTHRGIGSGQIEVRDVAARLVSPAELRPKQRRGIGVDRHCSAATRSMNRAVLEKVEPSGAVDLIRLIGHGISKSAPLPTKRGPFVANGPVHLVGSGGWRPVDRSELKVIVLAQAIRVVISFVTG